MKRPVSLMLMAILALVQGAFGLLRAFGWVQIGVDLFEHGLLLMPMLGAVAMFRGSVIGMVAILYLLFAVGAMIGFTWSWAVGLTAALINVFLALIVLIEGVALGELLPWVIIPTILVVYLFSPPGRKAFDF